MQLLIERDSGAVTVDGRTHIVDCTSLQAEVQRVRWLDDHGEIHFRDGKVSGLGDIMRFRQVLTLWQEKEDALKTRR